MKERIGYRGKELYCERVPVRKIVKAFGTPLYIYSQSAFTDQFARLTSAFKKVKPLICYSVKACSNLAILRLLVKQGAGLDIVSGGELFRATKVNCPMDKVVFAGVGKTAAEIETAIRKNILFFNVESEPELKRINIIAKKVRRTVDVALRLNPDVESHTHHYITTAKKENKFGIDFTTAKKILKTQAFYKNIRIRGIHLHVGSQLTKVSPFIGALDKTLTFLDSLGGICKIDTINLGGGIGIKYDNETTFTLKDYAEAIERRLVSRGYKLILEPGRFMCGDSAIFVTEVQYIKKTKAKQFVIVDGAMNDLIRPALYQAYHKVLPLVRQKRPKILYDVVGPVCESGDFFAKKRPLQEMRAGEYLALKSAGAYGFAMSSNYNTRGRAAEILINKNKAYCIRSREKYSEIIRSEIVPTHLK